MKVFVFLFLCLVILFIAYLVIAFIRIPKYQKRELICSCDLLPIIKDIYVIKTCKNKLICKYVDCEDEDKIKIDILGIDTDIVKMPEGEKPTFYLYERKLKNGWLHRGYSNKYIGLLSIPETSVLSE